MKYLERNITQCQFVHMSWYQTSVSMVTGRKLNALLDNINLHPHVQYLHLLYGQKIILKGY
jgi:hypothetical protein